MVRIQHIINNTCSVKHSDNLAHAKLVRGSFFALLSSSVEIAVLPLALVIARRQPKYAHFGK